MNLFLQIITWGLAAGIIHFVIVGILYKNPFVDKFYTKAEKESPAFRKWANLKKYLLTMFLGTQVEIYILTAGYLFLRQYLDFGEWTTTLLLGLIFSGIRVYPRFWNMWIQTTYPRNLLAIEFVNGTLSTFTVVVTLHLLPV